MSSTYRIDQSRAIDQIRSTFQDHAGHDPGASASTVQTLTSAVLSDEEIQYHVDNEGITKAKISCGRKLAVYYGLKPGKMRLANGMEVSFYDRIKQINEIINSIESESSGQSASLFGSSVVSTDGSW